jgi:cohesin complex subunit SCC1
LYHQLAVANTVKMFFSETLLSKTGPLSRIWLSANTERKLSKTHILQSNLPHSIEAIITPDQAPMALRLSGQLLLGVVRIYSRKTRYLLDDCNEALLKIKMVIPKPFHCHSYPETDVFQAFRSSGNTTLPANLHIPNRESLMLPDRITPYDNLDLLPPPDANFLSQFDEVTSTPMRKGRASNRDINLQEDFNNSQYLNDNHEKDALAYANNDDLELDLDFDMDDELPMGNQTVEVGRNAPTAMDDDVFSELPIQGQSKANFSELPLDPDFGDSAVRILPDGDGDLLMDDFNFDIEDSAMPGPSHVADIVRTRISESPLSDVAEDDVRVGEIAYNRHNVTDSYEPIDETETSLIRKAPQRARKMKFLLPDAETTLSSNHIRDQQANHENILKPQSFLPRDPYFMALQQLQKSNGFVSSIMLDDRSSSWAPELRGLISVQAVYKANELKRKRDSGIADMDSDQGVSKSPRLDVADDDFILGDDGFGNNTVAEPGTMMDMPGEDGHDTGVRESLGPAFDDTMAPAVHPADSGPVAIGTKHAVHILRDLFGAEAANNADKRKKSSVVFQELLPERRTTKADATKMFFECLVLATKDAIKVEQPEGALGGPIRVRGKRGLWGAWAEREAGGEMEAALEEEREEQPAPLATGSGVVAVTA